MQARFLLGPAGSGKTHRCLADIRDALAASPEGPPLILLAPKQATFQLERQLLDSERWGERPREPLTETRTGSPGAAIPKSPEGRVTRVPDCGGEGRNGDLCNPSLRQKNPPLPGYTRLHILSFERLAQFVFDQLGQPAPELLSEAGRVMVLRALLEQNRGGLQLFRASARLPGFARQLSELLRELQHYHLTPPRLESLAGRVGDTRHLNVKLRDIALILRAYEAWLKQRHLEDADHLLDLAADALKESPQSAVRSPQSGRRSQVESRGSNAEDSALRTPNSALQIAGLWLDGFAQMTPQERRLLSAVAQCSDRTTLAFCLDGEPGHEPPWHSIWASVAGTFLRCRDELGALPGVEIKIETLERNPNQSRFQGQPALQHLEKNWAKPAGFAGGTELAGIRCGRLRQSRS